MAANADDKRDSQQQQRIYKYQSKAFILPRNWFDEVLWMKFYFIMWSSSHIVYQLLNRNRSRFSSLLSLIWNMQPIAVKTHAVLFPTKSVKHNRLKLFCANCIAANKRSSDFCEWKNAFTYKTSCAILVFNACTLFQFIALHIERKEVKF